MSFMKAATLREDYSHVLSFRRQIHVQPNETLDLPASMVLKHDNTNYRIFLNFDDVCFKCKLPGHFAQDCPGAIAENGVAAVNTSKTNTEASLNKRQTTDDAFAEDNPLDFSKSSDNNDSSPAERQVKKIGASDSTERLTPTYP
ncbi:hypothetical protein Zmor_024041 [Zophobas morio]|uniref:CCHC-type domain-containing protein n=1 Tax=Zophobas morio TaxID=2755281 RepID=A0AA38HXU8_9CUCU|nr:hypothetical protein Zmor_024041 [Zophobas morio]